MSPARRPTRRDLLRTAAGATALTVAGCLSEQQPIETEQQPAESDGTTPPSTRDSTATPASGNDSAPTSGSWRQFGADVRNTGHAPDAAGPGADGAEIAWRFDAGTPTMNTSPVVREGTVYVPGSGDPGLVHAVDLVSGEGVWAFEPTGYATSSLALVDGTLYIGTWGREFYAVDAATGDLRWRREVGHRFGNSSPAVVDGTVYVGTVGDGPLVVGGPEDEEQFEACAFLALDAETGDLEWDYREFDERENIDSSPAVDDGTVYFGGETSLYALDAETGEEVWTRDIPMHVDSSPAVADGVVYHGAPSDSDMGPPARLLALDAASGETLWTAGIEDQSLRTSPAVADGTVYVAASSRRVCMGVGGEESTCSGETRGRLYAVDAANGDERWRAEIETDTRSSPAVADGTVYVGCDDGLSAVTTDGDTAWLVGFESDDEDAPYVDSSPAVAGGHVFIGASDGQLRAVGPAGN